MFRIVQDLFDLFIEVLPVLDFLASYDFHSLTLWLRKECLVPLFCHRLAIDSKSRPCKICILAGKLSHAAASVDDGASRPQVGIPGFSS